MRASFLEVIYIAPQYIDSYKALGGYTVYIVSGITFLIALLKK